MTENDKTGVKKRTEMLAGLRQEHREQVKETQLVLKEQQRVRKEIRRALQAAPRTVPQLADDIGMPPHEVLWHIAAMKKYGDVVEAGLDESYEYYLYGLAKEAGS